MIEKKRKPYINLGFIRAAIRENTGISLSMRDVGQYLVDEGLATQDQVTRALYFTYSSFSKPTGTFKPLDKPVPVDHSLDIWVPLANDLIDD